MRLAVVLGLAFALPLVWFAVKRQIPQGFAPRLIVLLLLGGLQGAIGWWMVQSGLSVRTDVSHVRLAVHLLMALFLLAAIVWTALDLRTLARDPSAPPARMSGLGLGVIAILFVQLLYGALVAGLNAGLVTNEWPLMNGRLVPQSSGKPFLDALFNDPWLVHFVHRWWAWVAVAALVTLARKVRTADRSASVAIHSAFGIQILLGIATVWTGVSIWVAALHQLVGALLVIATAWGAHSAGRR